MPTDANQIKWFKIHFLFLDFDWCPIEVMFTLHFKWTSIERLGWIALSPCKAFILMRGWAEKYSFPSWSELRIVPMAHIVIHSLSLWGYEHSWVALSGDQPSHSMSMKFCSNSSQKPCSSLISPRSSVVPSRNEPYDHLRVSHHRHPLGWLFWVLLLIISMQGSLLHLCTNLAAWTTINQQMVVKLGTTSPLIATGGIPMVELATINKAPPGDSLEKLKKIFLLNKNQARTCF